MKLSFFKSLILVLVICLSTTSFAQNFQGKAYYQTKTAIDMSQFMGGRKITPDQMKFMEKRMKSFLEKQYTLIFNKQESIYKEEERLEAGGSNKGWGGFASSFTGGPKYKNVKSKEVIQDQEFFGKKFLIKDELRNLDWKMANETKQIGNYTVFKAVAVKPVIGFDWRSMKRRGDNKNKNKKDLAENKSDDPMDEMEIPKTTEVIAWYTPQIPINQGPDDFWGLPGLILEVSFDRTTILCTKIVMNPKEKDNIKKPEKGEIVTQEEYTEITTKKMEEMRSNWRGRGRGGKRN